MTLEFEDIVKEKAPSLTVALITADITNADTPDSLWEDLNRVISRIKDSFQIEMINKHPAVSATRAAYKAFGKDPNRYRPSAEALMRRAVKGMELYRTTTVVDLINLVSLATGHSIGAFDGDKIQGDSLTLGVGVENEPYEAIGRGQLNIGGLPVWRDEISGIGTPTSDNDRTKLTPETKKLVVTVNCYGDYPSSEETAEMIIDLLKKYAEAENLTLNFYKP